MPKGGHLGEFEQIVLLALLRLGEEAYGMSVRQEIEARTRRAVAIGAVYATLDRLEQKGLVRSWTGDSTARRGGRAKRYFRVTGAGVRSLKGFHRALEQMCEGLSLT